MHEDNVVKEAEVMIFEGKMIVSLGEDAVELEYSDPSIQPNLLRNVFVSSPRRTTNWRISKVRLTFISNYSGVFFF